MTVFASDQYIRKRNLETKSASQTTQRINNRSQGFLLVELLVALVMAALVSLALFEGYSTSLRATSATQNQILASSIAQEAIDEARNQTWTGMSPQGLVNLVNLYPPSSPQQLPITASQTLTSGMRPLGMNTDLSYSDASINGQFVGTCTRSFSQTGGANGPITVTVNVTWQRGTASPKTLSVSTMITKNGIHI
ncbi:MAG: prepilin-type N-terminal cleavage/methylation domain-containing protein [Candidatus Obscuribacterales bacterium]|nr:prepilin-type N-terminal cleavage/methylation domain-containing protein [Candidatus Obscuribacterales bacterium]